MNILIVFCGGKIPPRKGDFNMSFDDTFAMRFIKNIANEREYCNGCGVLCDHCRDTYNIDFSGNVVDIVQLPSVLPFYIDDAKEYFGEEMTKHDATIAINVHEELLLELPEYVKNAGSKVLLVPSEHPDWVSRWVRSEVKKKCVNLDIACAFPKPFCALEYGLHPAIDGFMDYFKMGKPELQIEIRDGHIVDAKALRSAPCGATYYVAFNMKGKPADESIFEVVAKYWHSFPCVGSMSIDREIGDTILHEGGLHHYNAAREAFLKAGCPLEMPEYVTLEPATVN